MPTIRLVNITKQFSKGSKAVENFATKGKV